MRIKTFYAKSMADALNDIRETLGPDALLLTSKDLPRRAGAWGRSGGVEVVAAVDSPEGQEGIDVVSSGFQKLSENQKQLLLSYDTGKTDAGSHDTPRARRDIPSSAPSPTRAPNPAASREPVAAASPSSSSSLPSWRSGGSGNVVSIADAGADDIIKSRAAQKLCYDMVECGVDSDLARRMVSQAVSGLPAGKRRNRLALIAATSRLIPGVAAEDGGRGDLPQKRIVAFIGPTGVGKTTSISKLAAHLALGRNKKVILLSMDSYRIGAIEQLRSYAGLMGIPFRFVSDVSELRKQIADNSHRDYILLDTAGRGIKDIDAMKPLAGFLRDAEDVERHLVLSASMKPSDMRRIAEHFESCGPDHLLFTKLDETFTLGPILNELERTRKGFSYYTDGQRVPDDLHVAARERILDLVLNQAGDTLQAQENI